MEFGDLPPELSDSIFRKCHLVNLIPLSRVSKRFVPIVSNAIQNCFHHLTKSEFNALKHKINKLDQEKLDKALKQQKDQTLFQLMLLVHATEKAHLWTGRIEPYIPAKQIYKFERFLKEKNHFVAHMAIFSIQHDNDERLARAHQMFKQRLNAITTEWLQAMQIPSDVAVFDNVTNILDVNLFNAPIMFYKGLRFLSNDQDIFRGVHLILIATRGNFPPAFQKFGMMHATGENVQKNLNLAIEYLEKAVTLNDVVATCKLAHIHLFDEDKYKDLEKGFKLAKKAALTGLPEAQYTLGFCFQFGLNKQKDIHLAQNWYLKAARNKFVRAMLALGMLYYDKNGRYYNLKKGFKWLLRAAQKGHDFCQMLVGYCYFSGMGVLRDYERAFYWTKKANSIEENPTAMNNLAAMYEHGIGIEKNLQEAHRLYKKAAEAGHEIAKINLANLEKTMG